MKLKTVIRQSDGFSLSRSFFIMAEYWWHFYENAGKDVWNRQV